MTSGIATSVWNHAACTLYTVFRKKHTLTFSFISPWIICGFKQKLQRIYPRIDRFWQRKIRYSLRSMT